MYKLQTLNLPIDWKIEFNDFLECDITNISKNNYCELHEDLLQLSNQKENLIIDLGLYPDGDENGNYILLLVKNCNWELPLKKNRIKFKKRNLLLH